MRVRREALIIGTDTVRAEVAATEEMRQVGLMFRTAMGENEGMLFVFDSLGIYRFWMRNTELPLSIAFITREGSITNIVDMVPHDERGNYEPPVPVLYALEMNQGWFVRHGVKPGDLVRQLPTR